jgi:hypothetical protein
VASGSIVEGRVRHRPQATTRGGACRRAALLTLGASALTLRCVADAEIVAYRRGPYCVLAVDAVTLLRNRDRRARRLRDRLPE